MEHWNNGTNSEFMLQILNNFVNLTSVAFKQHLIFFTVYVILKDKKFGGELYGTVLQYYRLLQPCKSLYGKS